MKFKPGAAKWLLTALISGTASAVICLMAGLDPLTSNLITMSVSAGVIYGSRDKWLAK